MGRRILKFTPEQMRALASNPYTAGVDFRYIWFTEEFMKLFLERYENGESSHEIFASCGYDTEILGMNRIYNFPRRAMSLLGIKRKRQVFTGMGGMVGAGGPQDADYDTMPIGQSVLDMQRELEYLRKQVQFLKKNAEANGVEVKDDR